MSEIYDGETLWITVDEFHQMHPLNQWTCPNCCECDIKLKKREQHRFYMTCGNCGKIFTRRELSLITDVKGYMTNIIMPKLYVIDQKFDQEKPIAGTLGDFSLALMELSKLLTFGAKKYERSSWLEVPDNEIRYKDALWRHLLSSGMDEETGLGHDVAVVFNALATLELRLRREANEA